MLTNRSKLPRRLAFVLPVLVLAGVSAHPSLAQSLGIDLWELPALQRSMEESRERARQLEYKNDDVRKRIMIKEILITDLIEGRSTLEEVAGQFLTLNETSPEYMEVIRSSYEGSTDLEKTIQNVIDFASVRVPEGERRDQLVGRLQEERARINLLKVTQ